MKLKILVYSFIFLLFSSAFAITWTDFSVSNVLQSNSVNDVFFYDITKDDVDYTTWFNDSSKSWWQEASDDNIANLIVSDYTDDGIAINVKNVYDKDSSTSMGFGNLDKYVSLGFSKIVTIDNITVVNTNTQDIILYYSNDSTDGSDGSWTQFDSGKLPQNGNSTFDGFTGKWFRLYVDTYYGGSYASLDEIIFNAPNEQRNPNFPLKSYLIATDDGLDIIDSEDNSLWMRFEQYNDGSYNILRGLDTAEIDNVYALNGRIYAGVADGFGINTVDFVNDVGYNHLDGGRLQYSGSISERNDHLGDGGYLGTPGIISPRINDVHAAYIDGVQYVAVATDGGVSVINESDNSVFSYYRSDSNDISNNVFLSDDTFYYELKNFNVIMGLHYNGSYWGVTDSSISVSSDRDFCYNGNGVGTYGCKDVGVGVLNDDNGFEDLFVTDDTSSLGGEGNTVYIADHIGLSVVQESKYDELNSNYLTYAYDTAGANFTFDELVSNNITSVTTNSDGSLIYVGTNSGGITEINSSNQVSDHFYKGGSASFDGTEDYVSVNDDSSLELGSNNFTFSIWVNTDVLDGNFDTIFYKDRNGLDERSYGLYKWNTDNFWFGISSDGSSFSSISSSTPLSINTWYHIAVTRRNNNVSMYVNGIYEDSMVFAGSAYDNSNLLLIGDDSSNDYFDGLIDEIIIYNKSLTAEEINSTYQRGLQGLKSNISSDGLVAYYPFDYDFKDHSGNGNDGTAQGDTFLDEINYQVGQNDVTSNQITSLSYGANVSSDWLLYGTGDGSGAGIINVTQEEPAAGNVTSTTNLLLNGTDNDLTIEVGTTIDINCSVDVGGTITLYQNGTIYNSGISPISNTSTFNTENVWNFTCSYAGNATTDPSSETHILTVSLDITPPGVITNLQSPSLERTWIYWNWTNPTDSDFNGTYIYIDDVFETILDNETNEYNLTGLTQDTSYTIKVSSYDTSGNFASNVSLTNTTLAELNPQISIDTPGNSTTFDSNNFTITYTVTDGNSDLSNCSIYGSTSSSPNTLLQENNSLTDGTSVSYDWTSLDYTTYYFKVNCTDEYGYTNTSGVYEETTQMNYVTSPTRALYESTWIYWNWTNPINPEFSYSQILIDGVFKVNTSNAYYNFTSALPDANYTINITAYNDLGVSDQSLENTASTVNITTFDCGIGHPLAFCTIDEFNHCYQCGWKSKPESCVVCESYPGGIIR